ncbi:MAG: magnesium transporter [Deltaproteobacteria bacterium]|nr:magnesium transporter [Deltaproteobacteria bacterium]MBI3067073.1 magnesium transporter [Deltaproteobacteria bacterium]
MTNEPVPLTNFVSETASEHVCRLVPVTSPETQIGELRESLEQVHFESATHIGVCDRDKFVGVLRVEDLFGAPPEAKVSEIMDADPPAVGPGVDQEKAAWKAVQHGESALAVIDNGGRFVGFIPPDRLLAVLLHEHEEDMARVGGFLRDSSMARTASEEPVAKRFWHRVPWLLLGLLGAVLAADIVGVFEKQLQANVMLAFFIPGIVYLADAVGTQTEALVIRGLSVGVAIGRVVRREILTGLFVGFALAAVFFPIGLWRWDDAGLAMAVALSIFAACATASFVALSLPWALNRLGIDPAFGSGPLATVIQDLLSVIIYLRIATALLP